jgi:hypothetical protein
MLHGWIRLRFEGRIAIVVALRSDFAVAKREKHRDERLHPGARGQAHHKDSQDSSPLHSTATSSPASWMRWTRYVNDFRLWRPASPVLQRHGAPFHRARHGSETPEKSHPARKTQPQVRISPSTRRPEDTRLPRGTSEYVIASVPPSLIQKQLAAQRESL